MSEMQPQENIQFTDASNVQTIQSPVTHHTALFINISNSVAFFLRLSGIYLQGYSQHYDQPYVTYTRLVVYIHFSPQPFLTLVTLVPNRNPAIY